MAAHHPICHRHGRIVAVMFALGLALLQFSLPEAFGCGVCTVTTDAFRVSHPKSLEIAMSTRRAIDRGILPPSPGEVRDRAARGLIAAQQFAARHLAEAWISKQTFEHTADRVTVHVLFIDTHEVIAFDLNEGVATLQAEPAGEGNIVIVTTRLALRAVIDKHVDLSKARELSLIHVETSEQGRKESQQR